MDIQLINFRCYTDRLFHIPFGVNLIDGPSGRGKSTILNGIKYGLYGNMQKVCRYGEKKTTVKITSMGLDITRTNVPSRLVVKYNGKQYEDIEAQEMINKRFGRQFDITSYMVQKGVSQFFSLPGTDKLKILEELSLAGDEKITEMKVSIQNESKELKIKLADEQSQLKILDKQLEPPSFKYIKGLSCLSEVKSVIDLSTTLQTLWEHHRRETEQHLSKMSSALKQQQENQRTYDTIINALLPLVEEHDRLKQELVGIQTTWNTQKLDENKRRIEDHELYVKYEQKKKDLVERTETYQRLIENEKQALEKEISSLQDQILPDPEDVSVYRKECNHYQHLLSLIERITEMNTELALSKYTDIDTKWETSVKQIEKVKQFISDMDTRKCVQSCPHCKKGLVIQSQKIQMVEHTPVSESDKAKETDYKSKLPLLQKQEDIQRRLIATRDTMKIDLERLQTECGDNNEHDLKLRISASQSRIDDAQRILHTNAGLLKQINDKKRIVPENKYKDMLTIIQRLTKELEKMVPGMHCEQIDTLLQDVKKMEEAKRDDTRITSRLDTIITKIKQKEKERDAIQMDDTDYHTQIEASLLRQTLISTMLSQSSKSITDHKQYESSLKAYIEYRFRVKQVEEKKRRCVLYLTRLEQLDVLSKQVRIAEGLCLEQFIRQVNKTMMWYIEQFFPDQSLYMVLDSEKECKDGSIKNEINVQITQNQFPCEIKALSGGEHDRCALAFMLTINELSHSPCLFLDESISSLDLSLSEDVLEVIKDKQSVLKKIILLISHQANTGLFDHVITL
jgi:DNA repair exonuclease SbcCD ATPase subunit